MKQIQRQITLGWLIAAGLLTIGFEINAAKGGKPGGGPPAFGRADFVETGGHSIVEDGLASCAAGDHPLGLDWDFWDVDDPGACGSPDGVPQSDFDRGGRWIFGTGHVGKRYLVFHWQPIGNSPADPALDDILGADIADPTPGVDNLRIRLNADSLFKTVHDRQPTRIDLWIYGGGRPYALEYTQELYIVRDPNDPDIAVLTTEGDPNLGQPNVREAVLSGSVVKTKGKTSDYVGTYEMPLTIIVRRVPAQP